MSIHDFSTWSRLGFFYDELKIFELEQNSNTLKPDKLRIVHDDIITARKKKTKKQKKITPTRTLIGENKKKNDNTSTRFRK